MIIRSICIILTLSFCLSPALYPQDEERSGEIRGVIVSAATQEQLPGVNISLAEAPDVGTTTDASGSFSLRRVHVGTYTVRISAIGYVGQMIPNVVVVTGRATPVLAALSERPVEIGGVTVEENYYSRASQIGQLSSNAIDRSEVLRSPGSIQDVQRVVQNLPGVASSTDNINELIVRGGAPFENLTILEHMEIPSINHYANEFNSAGPINMVNADMVEHVRFSSGGFPAQYGDKSSAVMDLTIREGNRMKPFSTKTGLSMAGLGTLVEGGFAGGRGSYILSARNSLLEILDKTVGLSTISLTAIPRYWDVQTKLVYDLNARQRLSFNLLYGDSRINIEGDPTETDDTRRNVVDSSSLQTLFPVTKQHAAGISLRSIWGETGYSVLTLYSSGMSNDLEVREDYARMVRGAVGEVTGHAILNSRIVFSERSNESFVGAKCEFFLQPDRVQSLTFGGQILTSRDWQNDVFIEADTSRYDLDRDGIFETGPVVVPRGSFQQKLAFGDASKYYAFASDRLRLSSQLDVTLGLRYDHFTYSGKGAFGPRAGLSYQITPDNTTLSVAWGVYTQTHPFPYYGDRANSGINRNLIPMQSTHYVAGLEHILAPGLKMSIEGYYKTYRDVAVSREFIYSGIDTFRSEQLLPVGKRSSYGLELLLEQKQVGDYYGTLALSLSKSRMDDPRQPQLVNRFPSDYDYPVIVTFLGGRIVRGVRSWLNETPFFLKYPTYLLLFSDEMEISCKFRFQSGRPYTPVEFVSWRQDREGGVRWSSGAWVESDDNNSGRYPDYSRFDVQWLSRFYFNGWNINTYFSINNVFNTQNVFYEELRSDGTKETVYQFTFFPVLGVEVEF